MAGSDQGRNRLDGAATVSGCTDNVHLLLELIGPLGRFPSGNFSDVLRDEGRLLARDRSEEILEALEILSSEFATEAEPSKLSDAALAKSRGQVDTKMDKKKLSTPKIRGLTKPARKVATMYRQKKGRGEKPILRAVINEYLEDNPAESYDSIHRSLSAHPEAWKLDTTVDKDG